ncbi:SDR family NAD(P)-dependent oxidoreductase [Rathayibacter sp. VKM Ac-2759]|uniref:SDR family NAD(P)-dependent oxidoreductase n=1 Tax=Rathayibacter sp. VKM Ac-2759 TaxID=2609252 RepID=UPI0013194DA0|nr:SDR family NAD(P)-dependent oxidoreductase [Rathayibacter sp. VKM Ac-2759]QHC68294.1 SDR family NAD(P)-dependent oxidoreductase [Rathayibacter sp. VKM Ac-2759]
MPTSTDPRVPDDRAALRSSANPTGRIATSAPIRTEFDAKATADEVLAGVDLSGRAYVVTGGASGIGLETSLALARRGARVVAGVRDPGAASASLPDTASGTGLELRQLDLTDAASITRFTAGWEGRLDGLVANAGVMAIPDRRLDGHGWELQLATNYLGHFALARGLHRALADTGESRVVVLSSTAHLRAEVDLDDLHYDRRPYDRWNAYSQSKTADVLLATGIAQRWNAEGITANALMPGWITTNLQRHLDDATLRAMGAMDEQGRRIEQDFFKTPAQGAATSVLLAASPVLAGVTGRYFEDNQEAEVVDSGEGRSTGVARYAIDPGTAERLWETAVRALG